MLEEIFLVGCISIINILISAIEGSIAIALLDYDSLLVRTKDSFSLLEEVTEHSFLFVGHNFLESGATSIKYSSENLWLLILRLNLLKVVIRKRKYNVFTMIPINTNYTK